MLPRPIRTLVAVLATLGLIGAMTAVPVAALTDTPTCATTTGGSTSEEVTDGVTLTYGSDFACTDAAAGGTWSIAVNVTNDSAVDVSIDTVSLSHTSPPFGDDEGSTADAGDSLPLTLTAGDSDAFEVGGDYELVSTDEGSLVNLHLRAAGVTLDDESAPFLLGINVHVLAPGVELDDNGDNGDAEGRPSWVPGPPPWVIEMLVALFTNGFPWGTDTFPPADAPEDETDADAGPPASLQRPPPAMGGGEDETDADAGPPAWVGPAGPPAGIPAPPGGGDDDDEGDEGDEGAGPPANVGRP